MNFEVNIIYKNIRNIKISLSKDNVVTVTSPKEVTRKEIFKLLESKKAWLDKHAKRLSMHQQFNYENYDLREGSYVYFLGREYLVKLTESKQNLICEHEDCLEFLLNQSVIDNNEFKLKLLEEFYRDRADIILNNLVAKFLKITNQEIQRVSIKKTKTRWGSCNYIKKTINLNFNLILRDIKAIEYVVLHEIAHLTHPNHSREFYSYIASYMPDWKIREKRLK
ncbi:MULTISPECIES: M48 family metallopeptidase [unclassified Francisella]|uniref:M48 family metallopeptidase n=1 Tax=unclassified Francisella TaxID=2610885 RepID=UPI002E36DBFE|nr:MULTISPECIES: SprT family zinc-dependent metalloprotease [unclassified Francisella]MED7820060.1 SprT family zinc-dependent metalloprotease [Francisella sp. 19S2-4]MED7830880.1 SprT family zinc-dependent metalloprotease [Francisella sp. 19S2-10]